MFLAQITTVAPLEQYGYRLCFSSVFHFTLEDMTTVGICWVEFFPPWNSRMWMRTCHWGVYWHDVSCKWVKFQFWGYYPFDAFVLIFFPILYKLIKSFAVFYLPFVPEFRARNDLTQMHFSWKLGTCSRSKVDTSIDNILPGMRKQHVYKSHNAVGTVMFGGGFVHCVFSEASQGGRGLPQAAAVHHTHLCVISWSPAV